MGEGGLLIIIEWCVGRQEAFPFSRGARLSEELLIYGHHGSDTAVHHVVRGLRNVPTLNFSGKHFVFGHRKIKLARVRAQWKLLRQMQSKVLCKEVGTVLGSVLASYGCSTVGVKNGDGNWFANLNCENCYSPMICEHYWHRNFCKSFTIIDYHAITFLLQQPYNPAKPWPFWDVNIHLDDVFVSYGPCIENLLAIRCVEQLCVLWWYECEVGWRLLFGLLEDS